MPEENLAGLILRVQRVTALHPKIIFGTNYRWPNFTGCLFIIQLPLIRTRSKRVLPQRNITRRTSGPIRREDLDR